MISPGFRQSCNDSSIYLTFFLSQKIMSKYLNLFTWSIFCHLRLTLCTLLPFHIIIVFGFLIFINLLILLTVKFRLIKLKCMLSSTSVNMMSSSTKDPINPFLTPLFVLFTFHYIICTYILRLFFT